MDKSIDMGARSAVAADASNPNGPGSSAAAEAAAIETALENYPILDEFDLATREEQEE